MDDPTVGGAVPVSSTCSSSFDPTPFEIGEERWAVAEKAGYKVILKILPTPLSEERRLEVIDYMRRLIRNRVGVEVFPYGSVPLKTYLPDGDVDLTAFGGANLEDKLADEIKFLLQEEKNGDSEFVVKDVQLICAEVKLVKCIVQNIVVDVSLNQIGGLSTLCFLEQVDRLIGKDHLFKHSIILIKAWCYYESRILGAHHGLISTYALETMALYIFNFFLSSLDGPLAVLYKFLDYFSKFDWETYCVSLKGPALLSSLPVVVAEIPEDDGREVLLSSGLTDCIKLFSIPSRNTAIDPLGFQQKYLNIIDPLKESNNLGRSVSKGNFYRIRSAFSLGARKLAQLLLQCEDDISDELQKFFSNTMARHGRGLRPDVHDMDQLPLVCNGLIPTSPASEAEFCKPSGEVDFRPSSSESSQDVDEIVRKLSADLNEEQSDTSKLMQLPTVTDQLLNHSHAFHRDADNCFTSGFDDFKAPNRSPETAMSISMDNALENPRPVFAPHLFFSHSKVSNGSARNIENKSNGSMALSSLFVDRKIADDENVNRDQNNNDALVASTKSDGIPFSPLKFSGDMAWDQVSVNRSETPESLKSVVDLTGDYDNYLHSLEYGRQCYDYASIGPTFPILPPTSSPVFQVKNPWESVLPSSQFQGNGFFHQHSSSFHPSAQLYPMPQVLVPGVTFGWNEMPKPRGTGTYFPNTNQPPQGYRSSAMRETNQGTSLSTHQNNGLNTVFIESSMLDRGHHESAGFQAKVNHILKSKFSDSSQPSSPNGSAIQLEPNEAVEFELQHSFKASMAERNRQPGTISGFPGMRRLHSASFKERDRIALRSSYHLKDEDDFPPLSV